MFDTSGKGLIPSFFETNGQDWFNYLAASNGLIHVVITFEERINTQKLIQAMRHLADAEPILGCRFVYDDNKPYWQRLENLDLIEWCSVKTVQGTDEEASTLIDFLNKSGLTEQGPQVKAILIRTKDKDLLCIKINHTCCDGGGAKEYIQLLAKTYYSLEKGHSLPETNTKRRRDQQKLFETLGINPPASFRPEIAQQPPTWSFPWQPYEGDPDKVTVVKSVLQPDQYLRMAVFAKNKGVSINDLILTAYYRTLFNLLKPIDGEPMELMVTVDLRRYLPGGKAEALCNLSGAMRVKIGQITGERYEDTLQRVNHEMTMLKKDYPGVNSAIVCELIGQMKFAQACQIFKAGRAQAFTTGKSSPLLSNFGILSRDPMHFGKMKIKTAEIISPALYAPGFMLGVSTYNDVLTLTVSFYETGTNEKDVIRFMDGMQNELSRL